MLSAADARVINCASSLCSCQKNGLNCVTACSFCHGTECENALTASVDCDDDISDDEEDADSKTVNVESVSLPDVMYDDDFQTTKKSCKILFM